MALTTAVLNAGANGATSILAWGAIHSDATSGSQVSNERLALSWDPAAGAVAVVGAVPLVFTGASGGPATHFGVWSEESGGTFRGSAALVGDQTFNSAGEYSVTSVSLPATDET